MIDYLNKVKKQYDISNMFESILSFSNQLEEMIKNCNKIPKQTILKFLKIFRKSSIVKVNPMENITTLNKGTIRKLISVQYWGFKKAQAENKITQRGNNLIVLATKFFIENYKILQT